MKPVILPDRIDPIIHGRLRLGVMVYLADAEVADFPELKAALEATQGNLSANLITLESVGYIQIEKSFVGRKPRTRAKITPAGRRALGEYLKEMADLAARLV